MFGNFVLSKARLASQKKYLYKSDIEKRTVFLFKYLIYENKYYRFKKQFNLFQETSKPIYNIYHIPPSQKKKCCCI